MRVLGSSFHQENTLYLFIQSLFNSLELSVLGEIIHKYYIVLSRFNVDDFYFNFTNMICSTSELCTWNILFFSRKGNFFHIKQGVFISLAEKNVFSLNCIILDKILSMETKYPTWRQSIQFIKWIFNMWKCDDWKFKKKKKLK